MRIVVLHLFLGENLVVLGKVLDYFNVEAVLHDEAAFPRSFCIASSLVDRLKHRQIIFAAALIVVFTESRGRVNDSRTVLN